MHRDLAAIALATLLTGAAAISADPARAQCSVGDYLGTCNSDMGYAGCCPTANSIQWCEGALLCGIDCSGNPGHDCCSESAFAGCSDPGIEACVCALDDYCCDVFSGAWDALCVEKATTDCGACAAGGAPPIYCGWLDSEGFYDCRESPSVDPSGASPPTCEVICQPQCAGKSCGGDGCGGSCGSCATGSNCTAAGQCVAVCTPSCSGKQCGGDGCGGSCGQCTSIQTCTAGGQCQDPMCVPQCTGPGGERKECGSDGCLGNCGSCGSNETCAAGQCVPACTPACDGKQCGSDGCGGSCGACTVGESCEAGRCAGSCVASCLGRNCGDDGCGGSCGTCGASETCDDGACTSTCTCEGRACGDDGCGKVCGYCIAGTTCNAFTHQCDKPAGSEPDSSGGDEVTEAVECPAGQVWSAYAAACVRDPNAGLGGGRRSDEGCGGAGGSALWALLGLVLRGRRSRTPRAPTR